MGLLTDLPHLNGAGFYDGPAVSSDPRVAAPSNAHALCDSPRNRTDRHLRMSRARDGTIGFNFSTFDLKADRIADRSTSLDVLLRRLDHRIERAGEDHVGLGSDFDGGVWPDRVGDVTGVPRLREAMRRHGCNDALVAKLARENWLGCRERCPKQRRRGRTVRSGAGPAPWSTGSGGERTGPVLPDTPDPAHRDRMASEILAGSDPPATVWFFLQRARLTGTSG